MNAALAWRGLVASGPDEGVQRLLEFWRDLAVHDPALAFANFCEVSLARMPFMVEVSRYLYEPLAEPALRHLLRQHLALDDLTTDPALRARPKLFIGATDLLNGERVIFPGETLTYDDLVASAAVPWLKRPVRAHGRLYWDGLFTTNPPLREFTDVDERPDEIWVVQIAPQRREQEPSTMQEVFDRTNELAGNLSLGQELYFVDRVNQLLERHDSLGARYKTIRIRLVELDNERLDFASKRDRRRAFIEQLLESGRQRAEWFFDERSRWPRAHTAPPRSVVDPHRPEPRV